MKLKINNFRKDYSKFSLLEKDIPTNPFILFEKWYSLQLNTKEPDSNAMILSTVGNRKQPSSRVVLLKDWSTSGFIFFTNYLSRKGTEISANKNVSLLFYWPYFERQIRIEGKAYKIPSKVSDNYFNTRPLESRISAIISAQSKIIPDRNNLENLFNDYLKNNLSIKRPNHWGGFIVKPKSFEFWQGRKNRLHDRILYKKISNKWNIFRLSP